MTLTRSTAMTLPGYSSVSTISRSTGVATGTSIGGSSTACGPAAPWQPAAASTAPSQRAGRNERGIRQRSGAAYSDGHGPAAYRFAPDRPGLNPGGFGLQINYMDTG